MYKVKKIFLALLIDPKKIRIIYSNNPYLYSFYVFKDFLIKSIDQLQHSVYGQ